MTRKVIDIDKIFDDFLVSYINENRGKFSEDEWESKIVNLYNIFLETPLKELDGKTPDGYYEGALPEELCELLTKHVKSGVSVPDALCHALVNCECENCVNQLINVDNNEELVCYALTILGEKQSKIALDKCFDLILADSTSENLKELAAEMLADFANDAKEQALKLYDNSGSSAIYFLEIFARCEKDDRVFDVLIKELKEHKNDLSLYLSYVSKYGDDKALPYLLELIRDPELSYVDFKELKLAIECFGGEYNEERDFTSDKAFNKLKRKNSDDSECN